MSTTVTSTAATTLLVIPQQTSSAASLVFNSLAPTFDTPYPEQITVDPISSQSTSQYCGISNFTQTRVVGGGPAQLGKFY